jgi:outer membrane protein
LQRKQSEVQDDFNARRNEEMSRLQKILIEQVRIYAKAQNFDLVIADGVIYTTPTIDITPAILAQLQANPGAGASHAKAAAPASAPAPAPKPPGK